MTAPMVTTSKAASPKARLIQLDCLRGIAILLVLFHHTPMGMDFGSLKPIVSPIIHLGWSGVDMFFILSGFLVGGLLFGEIARTGALDVGTFLIRRAFKLWPSYTVFVAYYVLKLKHRGASLSAALYAVWPNFLHLQNYIHVQNAFALAPEHTWSLAVEEHFYLTLPLLLLFLLHGARRERLSLIPWIAAAISIVCLGLRLMHAGLPFDRYADMFPTHLRIDTLFLGVCLSYLYHFQAPFWRRFALRKTPFLLLGLALISPMAWVSELSPFVFTIGYTMLSIGYACILIAAVPLPGEPAPVSSLWKTPLVRGVAWVGLYSYSIYLWHQDLGLYPALHFLEGRSAWRAASPACQGGVYLLLGISAAVVTGWIMGKLVEFPVLRIRERFFGAREFSAVAVPNTFRSTPNPGNGEAPSAAAIS